MSEVESFCILLDESKEGAYHIKNGPDEVQRRHVIDRGNELMVQADLREVIHGCLSPSGQPASLIITDFQFIPGKSNRRFRSATIIMRFAAITDSSAIDPEVFDIAPKGHFSIQPTKKAVELTRSANVSLQGGAGGLSTGGGLGWELKESSDKEDRTSISGTMRLERRSCGAKNTAQWVLMENHTQKTGIPTLIRTAVLLRRAPTAADQQFQATVEITASVDTVSSLENFRDRVFGKVPVDDPVIFDPTIVAIKSDIDEDNLGNVELASLGTVLNTTVLSNTIAGKYIQF